MPEHRWFGWEESNRVPISVDLAGIRIITANNLAKVTIQEPSFHERR